MASRSKSKRSKSSGAGPGAGSRAKAKTNRVRPLRRLDEAFKEWRFAPAAGGSQYVGVVLLSLGSVAAGAAVFGAFWATNAEGPSSHTAYIFAAAALLLALGLLVNQPSATPLRVGFFGVGFEESGKTTHMRWYDVDRVTVTHGALQLLGSGKPLTLPLKVHALAARRIVAEAVERIPDRVELDEDDRTSIGAPRPTEGAQVPAEPPQVTTERCRASEEPLTFEQDVRLCGRCGVPYHKQHVPRHCRACDYKLKR